MGQSNDSEQFRHECEVRTVARWDTDEKRAAFLFDVKKKRGKEAAQRLRRDVWNLLRGAENDQSGMR